MSNAPTEPPGSSSLDPAPAKTLAASAVADVVARFRDAYDSRNVDAVVGLFAEHGDWRLGPGTFAGKAAIRRLLEWDVRLSPTASSRPAGVGIIVHGQVAVYEQLLEQTADGIPFTCPAITVLELNAAGEIEHARSYYDKLPILQQVASRFPGAKGWFFRRIVNLMVAESEKGLQRT
jgi:hypothetical protein